MRVALCTDGIHPHALGGMQRHSRLLAEHLAAREGIELFVLHPHTERVFAPALHINEVHVAPIDPRKLYLSELWRYSDRVADKLDELKPDAILSQGFCVWKGIRRFTPRLIVHPHGLEMHQALSLKENLLTWPFRLALRYIIRRSAAVVSLGGRLTGILHKEAKGSGARVIVIPNAVEVRPQPLPEAPADPSKVTLLFVGRFAFNKGIDLLMTVARRLATEGQVGNVRFRLAGDGPLLERYRGAGLPPNVELLGRVGDEQLVSLYREADALILPTRFEGMPTVVLEAMAAAKPIIVSDVGATAELVDERNGYLLPPGDADAFYGAIRAFVALPPDRRRMLGEVSHQRVKERFNWPTAAGQFEHALRQLTAAISGAGA